MSPELLILMMFGGLIVLLILGLPLTFCLGGIAVMVFYFMWGGESLYIIIMNIFACMWNIVFVAIPLFIMMGVLLERGGR